ncbi:MAG TPA: hypothetical protein VMB82_04355, partial [Acidimicrobiales bacterium]|nr:hypothetical protein [Acidimicrobiales bacterium]
SAPNTYLGVKDFSPAGIAVGPNGTIYVATNPTGGFANGSAIAAINPTGQSSLLWRAEES